jgi:hypothetical protein
MTSNHLRLFRTSVTIDAMAMSVAVLVSARLLDIHVMRGQVDFKVSGNRVI